MKIVADDKIAFLKGVFESFAEVVYLPGNRIRQRDLRDADVLLTRSITPCNAALLDKTSVKLIATATIGDDHIDKDYCLEQGITWATAKGCNANAVVQYFISGLMAITESLSIKISDKTIGIIGVGNIGYKVERICRALGMKVLINDPPRERVEGKGVFASLDDIRKEADIITLHVPLNFGGIDKTFHLIDFPFFGNLQKPVVLINTSRGSVVETEAFKTGILNGKISGSVVDVWENEPAIDHELLELVSVGTPHIAGYSLDGKVKATEMIVGSVGDFFGLPLKGWKVPAEIRNENIRLDCSDMTDEQVIRFVMKHVYNILDDNGHFRAEPDAFETIRGSYSFRKENKRFDLILSNSSERLKNILTEMGFNIIH
jgi:erythronate-4-phosphate dehydrogenase